MTFRSVLGVAGWALTFLLLTAVFQGEDRRLSLEIWLAACSTWFGILVLLRLLGTLPLYARDRLPIWSVGESKAKDDDNRPQELRSTTALVMRAKGNPRVLANQLRPRLVALADHSLLINHGIDRATNGHQSDALLGDLAWLLDDQERERTPTLEELSALLTMLDQNQGTL